MRSLIRVFLAGLLCMGVAAGAVVWLLNLGSSGLEAGSPPGSPATSERGREASDPTSTAPKGRPVVYDIDPG